MKKTMLLAAACLLVVTAATGVDARHRSRCDDEDRIFRDGHHVEMDLEDGELVIENDRLDEDVTITEDRELFVNGRRVETDRRTKRLLDRYVRQHEQLEAEAAKLGVEAAEMGAMGAKIGALAVAKVCRAFCGDDDDDDLEDLEDEIDERQEEIDRLTDKIEKKAEKVEGIADDVKRTHRKLRRAVPELEDLDWF